MPLGQHSLHWKKWPVSRLFWSVSEICGDIKPGQMQNRPFSMCFAAAHEVLRGYIFPNI